MGRPVSACVMLHTRVPNAPRTTRSAMVTVEVKAMDSATWFLVSAFATVVMVATSSMVHCVKLLAECLNTLLTGLAPWTSGAGQYAKRIGCSLALSVMVPVMHFTILRMASVLAHLKADQ